MRKSAFLYFHSADRLLKKGKIYFPVKLFPIQKYLFAFTWPDPQ